MLEMLAIFAEYPSDSVLRLLVFNTIKNNPLVYLSQTQCINS